MTSAFQCLDITSSLRILSFFCLFEWGGGVFSWQFFMEFHAGVLLHLRWLDNLNREKLLYFVSHRKFFNADLSFILVDCTVLMVVMLIEKFYTLKVYLRGKVVFPIHTKNLICIILPTSLLKQNFSRYANGTSI